ncbi:MAG: SDR family NAD(P)-dependent oxidoreductase [Candidatus Kerfeldbacteria bacterium]|nr:SDR family NAD(P)-dependent oxidoreductase [Candidatus Kerfeldbacteria bacterium]
MDLGLKNKIVLITGASGGIGAATARVFTKEGAKLVLHYGKNKADIEKLLKQLPPSTKTLAVSADIADEAQVANLFNEAVKKFGQVDIVVANAGIFPAEDVAIQTMDKTRWDKVIATDLTGAWLTAREFFKSIAKNKISNPSLVFVSSTAGVFGEAGHSEYAAAKAALIGLTLSLKNEITRLTPHGRVNAVAPGWTWSPMTEKFKSNHQAVTRALLTRPLLKIAEASDIANQIVILSSSVVSGQVTGRVAVTAGGMEGGVLWDPSEIDPTEA